MELEAGHRLNGLFALANAAFLLYALVRFVGLREACEDLRPLVTQTVHGLGPLRLALAWRRFVAPLIVVLALLFPTAVTGTDLAITIDDLPTHGPLPPGITRLAVADQIIEVLRRHGIRDAVGFVNGGQITTSTCSVSSFDTR